MGNVERKIITDAEADRIQKLPALSTILPIRFANGSVVDGLSITCEACSTDKMPDQIQADIILRTDSVVALQLYGVCWECKMITPCEMRIKNDGTLLSRDPAGNWREGRYADEKGTGIWPTLKILLGKLIIK